MNVRWVILFAAVAQDRSFTRAAARLNLAQPWLSAQIRKLETELGVPLFTREKNRIELTDEGAQLLPSALQLSDAAHRFRSLAKELGSDRGSVVRVGAHVAAIRTPELARLNDAFATTYPNFSLEVENAPTAELLDRLRGGALDVAFLLAPFDADGLEVLLLRVRPPFLIAPRREPFTLAEAEGGAFAIQGLKVGVPARQQHLVVYDTLIAHLEGVGAIPQTVPEPDGGAMEYYARAQGLPVVMLDGGVEDYKDNSDLIALPMAGAAPLEHFLARPQNALAGRAADRFWRLAKSHAQPPLSAPN